MPVLEWLMWQMGGFGPMPGQVHHFLQVKDEQDRRYGLERYAKETRRLYGVLDKRLGEVEFVGGDISIADFAILAGLGGTSAIWSTSSISPTSSAGTRQSWRAPASSAASRWR